MVKQLLGETFECVLGSDFFASYNIYQGLHQRCWVHLLRDGHDLKEQYPDDAPLQQWFTELKALYERARAPMRVLIRRCHRPNNKPHGGSNNMPLSRN